MADNTRRPFVSFVLATHNRCAVVAQTLARVHQCGLDRRDYEVVVVDNASNDGTVGAIGGLADVVVRLRHNAGSCAKADGVERISGGYAVFLDDDSYPHPGSVERMIRWFESDERLAAAGFVVHLPDGRQEGGALPDVFLGCGVGLRAEALRQVGGLDRSFFMQAEEYDLTFRLVGAGWCVRMCPDLHVDHLKTPCARRTARTTFYDIRNNLRVVARYLPAPHCGAYRADCLQRYAWLAERDGHARAFWRGALSGAVHGAIERRTHRRYRLSPEAFEHFFRWSYLSQRMSALAASGIRRVVLADLGKNVFAYHRAAGEAGVELAAIGDDRFRAPYRHYRQVPVLAMEEALALRPDAVVVANSSPVHGADTYRRLRDRVAVPVHHWFDPPEYGAGQEIRSLERLEMADSRNVRDAVAVTV